MSNCKKCGATHGSILLRQKDLYCKNCFLANVNHKFRACIGKNKILNRNENVLICLSGGRGSTVLLDLIRNAVALDNHKKLWIMPLFFHVIDTDENFSDTKLMIEQCSKSEYNLNLVHISEYIQENRIKPTSNNIPEKDKKADEQLKYLLNSMPSSSRNDYLAKIKRELYVEYANELRCNTIFTAETTSTLAVSLLSNLSLGRGSQVQYDVGFCDSRNQVKILRPVKDITHEEIEHYVRINELVPVKLQSITGNSLQSAIQYFITDLQENFPSTISTVCKTADKIGIKDENTRTSKCVMCESGLDEIQSKLTALEATNFSRTVSMDQCKSAVMHENSTNQLSMSMFPHVNKQLCYTCSKNYMECRATVPLHVNKILNID